MIPEISLRSMKIIFPWSLLTLTQPETLAFVPIYSVVFALKVLCILFEIAFDFINDFLGCVVGFDQIILDSQAESGFLCFRTVEI